MYKMVGDVAAAGALRRRNRLGAGEEMGARVEVEGEGKGRQAKGARAKEF